MQRSYIIALVACAGACGVSALIPGRPADPPPPVPMSQAAIEPPTELQAIAERGAKKEKLIARLIDGDLRLAAAAETFLTLNRDWPTLPPDLYEAYPDRTLTEQVAHMLVGAAELRLAADDPRREKVLDRLASELGDIAAAGD
jgi:hypothetical protein